VGAAARAAHVAATTRCTTLVPTPSFLPILRMPSPFALNSSIRASTEGLGREASPVRHHAGRHNAPKLNNAWWRSLELETAIPQYRGYSEAC
jgi:hypothetical protein